jgi:hypothetical protein
MTQATPPEPAPTPMAPIAPPAPTAAATQPTPARRPGLDPATRRQTFIVSVVIAALFYGTSVLNEALPANAADQGTVAVAGEPLTIGDGVRITPVDGWVSSPHDNGVGIRLEKGVVVVDLYPETLGGNAAALADAYLEDILKADATQLTTTEPEVVTGPDGTAARFAYQGIFEGVDVPFEGEVTAIFIGSQGVVADAWSSQGDLGGLLAEVHAMLDTIEVPS